MVTVSSLIASHIGPDPGHDAGTCYICGLATATGQRRAPSDTFTAWALCAQGDVLCPDCAACLQHRPVRFRPWLVTADHFRTVHKEDKGWLWEALMEPPEPPFAFYFTIGGQKQGWISGVRQIATSRDSYPVLTDWTDRPVLLRRADRERFAPLILALRAHGVSKRALQSCDFSAALWSKAIKEGWDRALRQALPFAGDPRWQIMVYASNSPKEAHDDGDATGA